MSALAKLPVPELPAGPYRYLQPGQLEVSTGSVFSTVLGSCVAVCLWDSRGGLGGMNHFLLPSLPPGGSACARFGSVAVPELVERVLARGAQRECLEAKVFGGARVLAVEDGLDHLGARNAEVALELLDAQRIRHVGGDVLGQRGRRLIFDSASGQAWVRLL